MPTLEFAIMRYTNWRQVILCQAKMTSNWYSLEVICSYTVKQNVWMKQSSKSLILLHNISFLREMAALIQNKYKVIEIDCGT